MRNYRYKEHEYAVLVMNGGFQSAHYGRELRLLGMYLHEVYGLSGESLRQRLCEFCGKYLPDYNEAKHYSVINYAVKEVSKAKGGLISIDAVKIYEGELSYIESLDISPDCRKVMLALLVQRKLSAVVYERKNSAPYTNICWGGGKTKYSELKKASNLSSGVDIHTDIIGALGRMKLVNILHGGLISLDWIYNTSETGEVVMTVTDFDNIGLCYDRYRGDGTVKECNICKGLYRLRANNQRYCCKDCAIEADLIKARARSRNRRNNNRK